MSIKRPLKAATLPTDEERLRVEYPILTSPKIDGIRCLIHPDHGGPVTIGKFKLVPNKYIQEALSDPILNYLDGELVVLNDLGVADFNTTQSGVMSRLGEPIFQFMVFDCFEDPEKPYFERLQSAYMRVNEFRMRYHIRLGHVRVLAHTWAYDQASLLRHDEHYVREGWEGTMIRSPKGIYKQGRSTLKQGHLLKLKRFYDAEGVVIDVEELHHNENAPTVNTYGLTERSSHKANKTPGNTLGALVLQTKWGNLRIGSGFDATQRKLIWDAKEQYIGKTVTFKYQGIGMQKLPRFPIFQHFREEGT